MDTKGISGSETEKNLLKTFAGESRARNKYNFYAEKAREEGYQNIANIFDLTAYNEHAHAREVFARYLGLVGSTGENLLDAAKGETEEFTKLYKEFEETARREGFDDIASLYKELREVEESHNNRFRKLYKKVQDDTVFKGKQDSKWICMNCGYIYEGAEAPEVCPLCKFPRAYFKPYCDCDER